MTSGKYGALTASLGVVLGAAALMLTANAASARPGAASRGFASAHARPALAHGLRHHRGRGTTLWPAWGDFSYGPFDGEPLPEFSQPAVSDIHYTCTYDIPWDWAHRCPPAVEPSARPYAPSCPSQSVTVPGPDGEDRTINVIRCY